MQILHRMKRSNDSWIVIFAGGKFNYFGKSQNFDFFCDSFEVVSCKKLILEWF